MHNAGFIIAAAHQPGNIHFTDEENRVTATRISDYNFSSEWYKRPSSEDSLVAVNAIPLISDLSEAETALRILTSQIRSDADEHYGSATLVSVLTSQEGVAIANIGDSCIFAVGKNDEGITCVMQLNDPQQQFVLSCDFENSAQVAKVVTNFLGKDDGTKNREQDNISTFSWQDIARQVGDPIHLVIASDGIMRSAHFDTQDYSENDRQNRTTNKKNREQTLARLIENKSFNSETLALSVLKSSSVDDISVIVLACPDKHAVSQFACVSDATKKSAAISQLAVITAKDKVTEIFNLTLQPIAGKTVDIASILGINEHEKGNYGIGGR